MDGAGAQLLLPFWGAGHRGAEGRGAGLCRGQAPFAPARAFVTAEKQRKLRTAAELYLQEHPGPLQPRFDVAEVYAPQGEQTVRPVVTYIESAF